MEEIFILKFYHMPKYQLKSHILTIKENL